MDIPRLVAYYTLESVGRDGAYANLALRRELDDSGIRGRDAGFATELVFGTLREVSFYDAVVAAGAGRDVERIDPPVRDILRLGAHQALTMRVPAHAAVDTSVALARRVAGQATGFVNAVMRRITERDRDEWLEQVTAGLSGDDLLAARYSHPGWIVRALRQSLTTAPGGPDRLADLLAVDNQPAPVTLVVRDPSLDVGEVQQAVDGTVGRWSPIAVRLDGGSPGSVDAVREGRAGVQDEGSQLVTLAFTRAEVTDPAGAGADAASGDTRWLDMCAGPGGKAALLTGLGSERGAQVTALELHEHRVDLVRHGLRGVPGEATVMQADARLEGWLPDHHDRVLLDAPCTGLGVLRRRPESRWRRSPGDLTELRPLQADLLRAALTAVRSGGVVAYVTCSPHLAETSQIVEQVLADREDIEILDAPALLPEVSDAADTVEPRYLRLWPHLHDTDGMFLALLRRR